MSLEIAKVPEAFGTLHGANGVWAGFKVKDGDGERYETVSMSVDQASMLASNLLAAITRAHKERGGAPAVERA